MKDPVNTGDDQVKEIWGVKFRIAPHGLAEDQVVAFVNSLMEQSKESAAEQEKRSSLLKLAEQTVVEADRLAEEINKQAKLEAEEEEDRIIREATDKAQEQVKRLLHAAQKEAANQSSATLARAEQDAEALVKKARIEAQDILRATENRAAAVETEARLEAEYLVRRTTAKVVEGIRSAVTDTCNALFTDLENYKNEQREGAQASNVRQEIQHSLATAKKK